MRKYMLTLAAGALFTLSASAVPARRVLKNVVQPDGTTVAVMLTGDESLHYFQTTDGIPLVQDAAGALCYARLDNGTLQASTLLAHDAHLRSAEEQTFLAEHADVQMRLAEMGGQLVAARNADRALRVKKRLGKPGVTIGKHKGLVILVEFQDKKMAAGNTREAFDDMMNKVGYTGNGNYGSVHDYFYAQSYGKFDLTFDVVGPVTVSKNLADYGANTGAGGDDADPQGMVYEACQLAAPQVDFSQYDWDGDGEVDQVFIICAGNSEAAGGSSDCIWPHESQLSKTSYGKLTYNGVSIDTYGCSTELYGTSTTQMDGIGTSCHEFSHCMGLPDFYDRNYQGGFGMDHWSIMSSGSYNGNGYAPVGYTAFERWTSGWLEPKELTDPTTVENMASLNSTPEAYIIYNDANRNEYYMLENRQQDGWFATDATHGMMITHVDYDESLWNSNYVNTNAQHPRYTLIPADNQLHAYSLAGDLYPNGGANTALTNNTQPAATVFNAAADGSLYMNKPITDITEADGKIAFNFRGGSPVKAPETTLANDPATKSLKVEWTPVEGASSYAVELHTVGTSAADKALLLAEDLGMMGIDLTTNQKEDIGTRLDENGTSIGWKGRCVYVGDMGLQLGSESQGGELLSPAFSRPATGMVTLRFGEAEARGDNETLTVSLCDAQGNALQTQQITPTDDTHCLTFEGIQQDFRISFSTKSKRAYLSDMFALYDGRFSSAEVEASLSTADPYPTAVKGITATSYSFDNLTEGQTYLCYVRADKSMTVSPWSLPHVLVFSTVSGINQAEANAEQWRAETPVDIYSVTGRLLHSTTFSRWSEALPHGAYVLRSGKQAKVMVK